MGFETFLVKLRCRSRASGKPVRGGHLRTPRLLVERRRNDIGGKVDVAGALGVNQTAKIATAVEDDGLLVPNNVHKFHS